MYCVFRGLSRRKTRVQTFYIFDSSCLRSIQARILLIFPPLICLDTKHI